MAWARIENLIQVDNEVEITTQRFSIPAGGSDPNNQGNCDVDILFYKEDVKKLLGQEHAVGVRLVNSFLNTPAPGNGNTNTIPLTFMVAVREENQQFVSLNQPDDMVAITCPPVYIRQVKLGSPQPGEELSMETIRKINANTYLLIEKT